MNEELLTEILESTRETTKAVSSVDGSVQQVSNGLTHLSSQLDILNHSIYIQNEYLTWLTVSMMLVSGLMMFLVGYLLTRK